MFKVCSRQFRFLFFNSFRFVQISLTPDSSRREKADFSKSNIIVLVGADRPRELASGKHSTV